MGNSLRCCLACVLPCGALDVIRIVHLNGHVEETTRAVTAGEILKANPNHVLSKPSSQGVVRKILILSPDSELKRGSIYFLIPDSSLRAHKNKKKPSSMRCNNTDDNGISMTPSDHKYLEDVVNKAQKICSNSAKEHRHRRRHSRSASTSVWRPHLQSISEDF